MRRAFCVVAVIVILAVVFSVFVDFERLGEALVWKIYKGVVPLSWRVEYPEVGICADWASENWPEEYPHLHFPGRRSKVMIDWVARRLYLYPPALLPALTAAEPPVGADFYARGFDPSTGEEEHISLSNGWDVEIPFTCHPCTQVFVSYREKMGSPSTVKRWGWPFASPYLLFEYCEE